MTRPRSAGERGMGCAVARRRMSNIQALSEAALAASTRSQKELSLFAHKARADINAAGRKLLEHGVLSPGRSFNAAVRVPGEEKFALGGFTPPDEELAPVAIVGFDGKYYEGKFKDSHLELLEVYSAILSERPLVNAAIHTHSHHIEAFAIAHRPIPVVYSSVLLEKTSEPIPVTPWEPRYSAEPFKQAMRINPAAPAILVGNHGPFAWGETLDDVTRFLIALEEAAQVILKAEILGGAKPFPPGAHAALIEANQ